MTTITVRPLEELNDREFRGCVERELRRDAPDVSRDERRDLIAMREQFKEEANVERWYQILVQLKRSVELQLGTKRSDLRVTRSRVDADAYEEARVEFERWRAGSMRFLDRINERLSDAHTARSRHFGLVSTAVRSRQVGALTVASALADAIRAHKRETYDDDLEPSEADLRLWAILDDKP